MFTTRNPTHSQQDLRIGCSQSIFTLSRPPYYPLPILHMVKLRFREPGAQGSYPGGHQSSPVCKLLLPLLRSEFFPRHFHFQSYIFKSGDQATPTSAA